MKITEEGYTFDDVLLIPQRSDIRSRKQVDTSVELAPNIKLNIPIVSANMDTVTESRMAIALAREGGLGMIHRYLTVEDQVKEVHKVKRAQGYIIHDPMTLNEKSSLGEVKELTKGTDISGIIVVDEKENVIGIVTHRDILFENDDSTSLAEIMTTEVITAPHSITFEEAEKYFKEHKIEKLPLVNGDKKLKGLITQKDLLKNIQYPNATKDENGRLLVGAAIGIKDHDVDRAQELVDAGVDLLVVDIAHGHADHSIDMVKKIKKRFPDIALVAGNVATPEGVKDLAQAGADIVKVGVGPGTTCITRIVSGSGYPQLSAVLNCAQEAEKQGVSTIADGGIRTSGDLTKALAAGAHAGMLGGYFSGTEESPGKTISKNGRKFKMYRGMASLEANVMRKDIKNVVDDMIEDYTPEGVEALVPYKGSVSEVLGKMVGGLRSGFSYCGAHNVKELWEKARFVKMTAAGMTESKPHDLEIIR
jgi:IMP dehydrogenase